MKRRLDERMWYLYTHCFNCQIEAENKLRISGEYDEWATKKVIANKLSWIKEQKQGQAPSQVPVGSCEIPSSPLNK